MTIRLVSAIWEDFGPFDALNGVNSGTSTNDPADLLPGDLLIVHGGADIHPSLYGKGRSRFSGAYAEPSHRDTTEWALMKRAVELDVPIIGICRGAQMLCALAGGYLIQHVNNHGGYHPVRTFDGKVINVNSIHHQMMFPFDVEYRMIAWCDPVRSDVHYDVDTDVQMHVEPEFVHFPLVKGYAIQWHPEMLSEKHESNQYVLEFLNKEFANVKQASNV